MTAVRKYVQGLLIADDTLGERQIRVIASNPTVDRVKDIMVPEGCVLENYKSNPIVLANHDPDHPIGNAEPAIVNGRVEAVVTFAQKGISAKADEYCGLYKTGVLRAVSVGFDPIDAEPIKATGGIRYNKWELMELSCVSVPANPDALTIARSVAAAAASKATVTEKAEDAEHEWKVGASRNLPLDEESSWDGSAAEKAIFELCDFAGDKPDTGKARKAFLVYDAKNPTLKGGYKLPFATVKDGRLTAVAAGIRAAASRLLQTDIPDDVQKKARAVIDHYEAQMKDGGKGASAQNKQATLGKNGKAKIKGLYECAELAQVLAHLGWIHDSAKWEEEVEQDASKLPGMLATILTDVAGALVAMTQEETAELLEGHGIDVMALDADYVELAATPQAKSLRAAFRKAGRVMSAENMEHLNQIGKCLKAFTECHKKQADIHQVSADNLLEMMDQGTLAGESYKALMKAAKPRDEDDDEDDDENNPDVTDPDNADQELSADPDTRKRMIDVMERASA